MTDPEIITIKVSETSDHEYYVRFNRDNGHLIDVREIRQIYTPSMGIMSNRTAFVVELAQAKIGTPIRHH